MMKYLILPLVFLFLYITSNAQFSVKYSFEGMSKIGLTTNKASTSYNSQNYVSIDASYTKQLSDFNIYGGMGYRYSGLRYSTIESDGVDYWYIDSDGDSPLLSNSFKFFIGGGYNFKAFLIYCQINTHIQPLKEEWLFKEKFNTLAPSISLGMAYSLFKNLSVGAEYTMYLSDIGETGDAYAFSINPENIPIDNCVLRRGNHISFTIQYTFNHKNNKNTEPVEIE